MYTSSIEHCRRRTILVDRGRFDTRHRGDSSTCAYGFGRASHIYVANADIALSIDLGFGWRLAGDGSTWRVSLAKTLAQRGVKTLPETTTFLSHEPLTSFFKGMFPAGQVP